MKKNKKIKKPSKTPFNLTGDKLVLCDVDDTLLLYKWPKSQDHQAIEIKHNGIKWKVVPHKEHIEFLKKLKFLGWHIGIWSLTGNEWASLVSKRLGLDPYVDITMSKPSFYIDDLECQNFMGNRVYKENK